MLTTEVYTQHVFMCTTPSNTQETSSLQKKQQWYQDNQQSFQGRESKEEDDYIEYCREAMFRIHILERRLMKHKSIAPQKYREMEERLRTDPRLSL
jgi:hypothetical protein